MKKVLLAILFLSAVSFAQQASNIYAFGPSYNSSGSPSVAGTALYAHSLTDGTYAFTVADVLPNSVKPFTVTTSFGGGIAQKAFSIGKVPVYVPTSAGISFNGSNTGWAWSTGGLASIAVKNNFRIMPNVRVVKSSVSNGTGYQPVFGVMFAFAQ